jgi:hypothetical protein
MSDEMQASTPHQPIEGEIKLRPAQYKKWHRWQWGWIKWLAFVGWIARIWPRNS